MTLQAPNIKSSEDVADFMSYSKTWVQLLHQHHDSEEEMIFPLIESEAGVKSIMDNNIVQHEVFSPGLERFTYYISAVSAKKIAYDGNQMAALIAGFAPLLVAHLGDEIGTLRSLEKYAIESESCSKKITAHALKKLDKVGDTAHPVTGQVANSLGFRHWLCDDTRRRHV